MELRGLEPLTFALPARRSAQLSYSPGEDKILRKVSTRSTAGHTGDRFRRARRGSAPGQRTHVPVRQGRNDAGMSCAVLHADLDAFYASVEQRDDPALKNRAVIVGGGVVLAASYEARARGVRTAMAGWQARRLCPEAVLVPARMSAYSIASKAVFEIFEDTAPLVEALSIDEAFLDVRGLEHIAGTPRQIAETLRARVRREVGLPITVGIARTKFLAKLASAAAKPDGILEVPADRELEFLHPRPVVALWGVGRVTAEKLHARGISTVAQIAATDEATLVSWLGLASGRRLHALAHNDDPRPVRTRARRRSIGAQRALGRRRRGEQEIHAHLTMLAERVGQRLRAARRACRTIVLRLRFADYAHATRSSTMRYPTDRTEMILAVVRELLRDSGPTIERRGLTLIGISLTNLSAGSGTQLTLPCDEVPEIDATLDGIRERFGATAITRGALLGYEPGPCAPLLPDP